VQLKYIVYKGEANNGIKQRLTCGMNYLAHAYLSFRNNKILVGNMISDFVKGRQKFDYPLTVQNGIMLHRNIDTFTDDHEATKEAKKVFKPLVGLYAGAFVDVVYDHFLANDAGQFSPGELEIFAQQTYSILNSNISMLPLRFSNMLPYMISQDWLFNYRLANGIERSFTGLFRRAKYIEQDDAVFHYFIDHYTVLQKCYDEFFPSVKQYAFNIYSEMMGM
jgi:acyl carrier protein phosphodiesterase